MFELCSPWENNTPTPPESLPIHHLLNPPRLTRDESAPTLSEGSSPSSRSDQFPFLTRFIHQAEQSQSDIWVRDLELMHHWTVETSDTLSQREDINLMWKLEAPQRAVHHRFLMHEILALAALHKAHKLPEQRSQYYAFGIHHQDLSIRGVREKILHVTPHEAAAVAATSTLLTLSVFASTGFELVHDDIQTSQGGAIDGILNIFSLMQGMGKVLAIAQMHILDSWIAPSFREPTEAIPSQPMLQELINQIPPLIHLIENKSDLPEAERKVCLGAIAGLEPVLQMCTSPCMDNRELRFLFIWPMRLQADFMGFLRNRHPGALAIVMYYTTMLFVSQSRYWFLEAWGEQLMRACYEELDVEWRNGVQWPASFINHKLTWDVFHHLVKDRPGSSIPFHTLSHQPGRESASAQTRRKPEKIRVEESSSRAVQVFADMWPEHAPQNRTTAIGRQGGPADGP
ncbi:hypothetical protein ACEQ8H_002096 [Pleosporales sp. CAS-2024a]